ncbi:TonB-dependent receptor domain-containing protein [Pedobacter sp. SYSU D00535]|uniref:TonB-dependent receptor n=1 Tax=Pedobacter sp. SYSU D00535 TaxID=2810308 RepID=UPI001A9594E4|nr:TonB-dependent receptor [Pedobacter sp. SYSU D00535]
MRYRVYSIITLVCLAVQTFAQQADCRFPVEGLVIDSVSREAVPGASIRMDAGNKTSFSDEHGHFSFNRGCSGKAVLTVTALGYQPYRKELVIGGPLELTLQLQPTRLNLQEVEVRARKPAAPGVNANTTVSGQQLEQTKGGTLADVLKSVPGVSTLQAGATITKPVIQGLHSNRLLILNNGIRQEGQQWGMEHAPEIDPFVAQSVTVVKGAEGIRFGPEAIGGVILVKPSALPKQGGLQGELNLTGSSNGAAGAVSGRIEGGLGNVPGFGWRLQGTGRASGNGSTADYYLDNTGVRELNFSGALGYSRKKVEADLYFSHFNTEIGIFRGSHVGDTADITALISHGRPFNEVDFSYQVDAPRQRVAHSLLKLESHFHLSSNSHIDLIYGLQQNKRQEYDIRRGGRSSIPSLDLTLITQTLDLFLESMNSRGWKHTVGLNGLVQVNNNTPGTSVIPLIPNYDTYNAGVYYIGKLSQNNYQLEAGARYDHKYLDALGYDKDQNLYGGTRTFHSLSFSLGGVIYFSPGWSLRSNLASAWRPPVVSELFSNGLHHGSASYEIGDETLESEKSYKWISTLEHQSDRLRFDLSLFLNRIDNYIYLKPSGTFYQSIRGVFPEFYYSQTKALLTGGDIGLSYNLTKALEYELKGALVRAKDLRTEGYLPWIPSDRLENSLAYRWAGRESFVKFSHLLVARQNRYESGSDYAAPPAGYQLLGLEAGTSFLFGKTRVLLNTSISNLGNTLYKDYMNRFRYYAHDQGRNITVRGILKF